MTGNKINVLHLVLDMRFGGLQRWVTDTAAMMHGEEFHVEVACLNDLGFFAEKLAERGITVTLLQKNQEHFDALCPFRLAKFLRKRDIDVLHVHTGAFLFGAAAAAISRVPVSVYTEHGRFKTRTLVPQLEDRISGWLIDRVIAVSKELERYLVRDVGLPAHKIQTVINGIETKRFAHRPKPVRLLDEFGLSRSTRILGTVARLDEVKDQASMLTAFRAVREKFPDSRLFLVGDGPMRRALSEFIEGNGLAGFVTITGYRSDIPEFLNLFDVFLLSSLSEGTSISLLEAMASGVPPVVTRVGGNVFIVEDRVDGVLVGPGAPAEMSDAIVQLLADDSKRRQIGDRAMQKARESFGLERMAETYAGIYLDLLRGKGRNCPGERRR
jgi:sugar transferase (PEP-CTERM/EpsH1 system associated)